MLLRETWSGRTLWIDVMLLRGDYPELGPGWHWVSIWIECAI